MVNKLLESRFSSPKIRCRKSSTIIGSPCRRETVGSHPKSCFAFVMSGFLLWGSSSVFGLNSIFAFGSIVSCTTCKYINPIQALISTIYLSRNKVINVKSNKRFQTFSSLLVVSLVRLTCFMASFFMANAIRA